MRLLFSLVATVSLVLLRMQPVAAEVTVRYGVQRTASPVYIALALGLFAPVERKDHIRFLFPQFADGSAANRAMTDANQSLQLSSEDLASCLLGASRLAITVVAVDITRPTASQSNGECVSDIFFAKRPDVVRDVLNVIERASDFIRSNPDASAELWSKQLGLSKSAVRASLPKNISSYRTNIAPRKPLIDAYVKALRRAKILGAKDVPKVVFSLARKAG